MWQLTVNGSIEDVVSVQLHVAVQHGSAHQSSHNTHNMEEENVQNLLIEKSHKHLNAQIMILVHLVSFLNTAQLSYISHSLL